MAEENQNKYEETTSTTNNSETEIKDRGVFDFLGGKKKDEEQHKPQEDALNTDFSHKVTLYEAPSETKVEEDQGEKKHTSLLDKLHRSDSSSSSSSEEEDENSEKRKKKKKEKKEDTSVPVEKVEVVDGTTVGGTEEKKGFLEKIKDKLPGHKKTEDVTTPPPVVAPVPTETTTTTSHDQGEKKGILEKIKEKIPGYHAKTTTTTTDHEDKDHHHKDETASH